jgi:hypothetical protein
MKDKLGVVMERKDTWMAGRAERSIMAKRSGIISVAMISLVLLGLQAAPWQSWVGQQETPIGQPVAQPILASQPILDSQTMLAPLPIDVKEGDTHMDLARKLVGKDTFMALALSVENAPAFAYVDAAGANAGAGYCIQARRRALGRAKIEAELAWAGFGPQDVKSLLSHDAKVIEAVPVKHENTLRLLAITKPQYEIMARDAVGSKVFDKLPHHKKDVLSYIAYNTGGPEKFVKLLAAVRAGDDLAALGQLAPSVKVSSGKKLKNHRLRAWAQAAWVGPSELGKALEKPLLFEKNYAHGKGQEKFIHANFALIKSKIDARRAGENHHLQNQHKKPIK